jgi:hypothetical protein
LRRTNLFQSQCPRVSLAITEEKDICFLFILNMKAKYASETSGYPPTTWGDFTEVDTKDAVVG